MLFLRCALLLAPTLMVGSLAFTAPAHAPPHTITFRDIEFDYAKDERLAVAKAEFGAEQPVGTRIPQAEAVLRKADARCRHHVVGDGLVCRFDMTDAPYNHLHDIVGTERVT